MKNLHALAAVLALCLFAGCKNSTRQRTDDTRSVAVEMQKEKVETAECPARNKLLLLPDSTMAPTMSLPVSLDGYLKNHDPNRPEYRPSDGMISFLQSIGFDSGEYACHPLPFIDKHILPILMWVCFGDNEYYLVVTIDVDQDKAIDHLPVGEVTDSGIISFHIDEEFRIKQSEAQIVYNETDNTYDIVDQKTLRSYRIGKDGKITTYDASGR